MTIKSRKSWSFNHRSFKILSKLENNGMLLLFGFEKKKILNTLFSFSLLTVDLTIYLSRDQNSELLPFSLCSHLHFRSSSGMATAPPRSLSPREEEEEEERTSPGGTRGLSGLPWWLSSGSWRRSGGRWRRRGATGTSTRRRREE